MQYLSTSQIREFLDPRAFSVPRTEARGAAPVSEILKPVVAANANSSYSLLVNAQDRLTDLRHNLQSMLDMSIQGARGKISDRKYDEIYGKLRSLTAGFDQVLDASTYRGEKLFDGRPWEIHNGAQKDVVDPPSLYASSSEAMGLVERKEGALVTVGYDAATMIRNAYSGLKGLDIASVVGIERGDGKTELENGKYRLQIEYNGPESRLILSDEFGLKLEEVNNIDLTGSGMEIVNLKSGLQFNIEKLQTSLNFDKWDYEKEGPVSLYADLQYERVSWHTLAGDTTTADAVASTEWNFKSNRKVSSPALNLLDISTNGVGNLDRELKAGNYSLKVRYAGEKSVVEIRDVNGLMIKRMGGVDLSGSGETSIDTGMGVRFTIENRDFDRDTGVLNATFQYTPAANDASARNFDFISFGQRLIGAIEVLDEQMMTIDSKIERILEIQSLQRGQSPSGSSATTLLGGAGVGGSLLSMLNGGNVQSRLTVSGMQLFSSINAAANTQARGANILSYLA